MVDETKDTGLAQPLHETWWEPRTEPARAPDGAGIFAPYEKTRPGFELIRADVCEDGLVGEEFKDAGDGYFEVCLWDIGHWARGEKKGQPGGDPADSDPEKQAINAMQRALGPLSDDDRLIRIQAACLNRCYYTFPRNIDVVIDGIATGKVNINEPISCDPPWCNSLLPLLRRRDKHPGGGDDHGSHERRSLVRAYVTILDSYLASRRLQDLQEQLPAQAELSETIYRRLGPPTPLNRLQVTRLRNALTMWSFRPGDGAYAYVLRIEEILAEVVRGETGDGEDPFGKLIGKLHNGLCHQFFFRRLDHLIAHAGAGRQCELPGVGEGRKFVIGTLVNYIHTLGSWVTGRSPDEAAGIWPPCRQDACRIYEKLGQPTPRKRWLAACLWKNLQEVQSWAGRGPLDEQPEKFRIALEG
jgi:hypothetical protein